MKRYILMVALVFSSLFGDEVYATFSVEARHDASLAFIAGGIVDRVYVDIGSVVKKGDILATLKNDDIKAMLNLSKTALKYAKKDYNRQLKIKNLIDEARFDGVSYKYENAKNQLSYQKALYDKTFLKAPFDGVIYEKNIEVGDGVSGMMLKTVFKIQSKKERKLLLEFDQKYNTLVKVGDSFRYTINGKKKEHTGIISKIYPHANTKNRKIKAEVEARGFITGLFGDGYILTQTKR